VADHQRRPPPGQQTVHTRISRLRIVYERVPHITLTSIANNAEIDVIWEVWQAKLEPLRESLNAALKKNWQEWEIPREADAKWPDAAKKSHAEWWEASINHSRRGGVRVSLRQAVRRQEESSRRRTVHGRQPQPAPHARRG
jgi:adenine-specific DNA-methyltransferase